MTEESSPEEQPTTFHIKTSGDAKYTVTVPLSMTVSSLKELLSSDNYAKITPDRQRLIYSGRVLKDPDTLSTYKIKENNTVHLVKGAESNVRNQAGNQGASSSATPAAAPNMATGTGANNLLAGLTGARYAGLAQLPNQSMFGPDGGMGPPADPEENLRQLENPVVRQQLSEMLNNPAVLDEIIRSNPSLANIPNARQLLQSPMVRQMMTDPAMIRQNMEMMRAMGQGPGQGQSAFAAPGGVDGNEGQTPAAQTGAAGQNAPANPFAMFGGGGAGAGAENPFAALMNPAMFGGQAPGATGTGEDANRNAAGSPSAQNPFASPFGGAAANNPMMQNMMRNLMANPELMGQLTQAMFAPAPGSEGSGATPGQGQEGGANAQAQNPFAALMGGAGAGGANPFAGLGGLDAFGGGGFGMPPAGPPDNRPPEERYADQLSQLNDMGFFEFDRNIEALRRSGGNVQGAVNFLLGG